MTRFAFLLLACVAIATPALAQTQRPQTPSATVAPVELGRFGSWVAYSFQGAGGRQCYALGSPQSSEPKDIQPGTARRNATNLFVTHRPGQNVRNEVSIVIGYVFKDKSNASVEVVSQGQPRRFSLFTRDQGAWLQNAAEESQFVEALRKGRELKVHGVSQRGTATTDTYALTGIAQALDRIGQECK